MLCVETGGHGRTHQKYPTSDGLGRLAALTRTELLGAVPEQYFDRVTRLATRLLASQTSLVSLVAEDRQFFISACGLGEPYASTRETPLSHSFCKHVVVSKEPLIVTDARTMPLLAKNPAVTDLNVIAYLGVPLVSHGEVIGALCVINNEPREWTSDNMEVLTELAHVIEDEIALRELATTATGLAQQNASLAREYHHRVKNALAVSAALVALSGKDAASVDDLISSARGRLNALASAHDALITNSDHIDLAELASKLLRPYVSSNVNANSTGPTVTLRNNQVTPICLSSMNSQPIPQSTEHLVIKGQFQFDGHTLGRTKLFSNGKSCSLVDTRVARTVSAAAFSKWQPSR